MKTAQLSLIGKKIPLFAILIALILFFLGRQVLLKLEEDKRSDAHYYQAVFLVNGQVYFGQLSNERDQFLALTDVYYLQVNQQIQPVEEGGAQTPDINLIRLGGEIHGPTNEMRINRDQILLIEDLRTDSNVVRAIEEYKKNAAAAAGAPVTN